MYPWSVTKLLKSSYRKKHEVTIPSSNEGRAYSTAQGWSGEATGSGSKASWDPTRAPLLLPGTPTPNASFSSVNVLNVLTHTVTSEEYLPCGMWSIMFATIPTLRKATQSSPQEHDSGACWPGLEPRLSTSQPCHLGQGCSLCCGFLGGNGNDNISGFYQGGIKSR